MTSSIGDADWVGLIGEASALMRLMMAAPTFVAERDDTRDETLHAIERLARRCRRGELEVAQTLLDLFARVTGETPRLWSNIISFGTYHYRYATGREGDAPAASFAPRRSATVVYLPDGNEAYADELALIGPHETGRSCLYLKDLQQNDLAVLEDVVARSYARVTSGTFGRVPEDGSS